MLGVVVFLGLSAAVVTAAGGHDQELVLFYAVAVFVSFLIGLAAMATFAHREHRRGWFVLNAVAAVAVAFTLAVNLTRPAALGSLAAAAVIAAVLYGAWVRAGRPRGVAHAVVEAEMVQAEMAGGSTTSPRRRWHRRRLADHAAVDVAHRGQRVVDGAVLAQVAVHQVDPARRLVGHQAQLVLDLDEPRRDVLTSGSQSTSARS